jgi:trk system potassium uptake protein TrkH
MLAPALYALLAGDGHAADFALPALAAVIVGASAFLVTRDPTARISGRDVFLIVVLGWISVAAVGSTPFVLSGLMGPTDAFFESMGGYTTTGASTVERPEAVARSLLLWRSSTRPRSRALWQRGSPPASRTRPRSSSTSTAP